MKVTELALPGLLLIEPRRFSDHRGWFTESWNAARYRHAGIEVDFVQDNVSCSHRGVLRGLHFQHPHPQGKLVWALEGEVWDVGVDIRPDSPTFAQWSAATLSAENGRQLFLPAGFAHGFVVTSERAIVCYKCTSPYRPEAEGTLRWDDPRLGIEWPVEAPILSDKDGRGMTLEEVAARVGGG